MGLFNGMGKILHYILHDSVDFIIYKEDIKLNP